MFLEFNAIFWFAYFVVDAHTHLHIRVDCVGKGVHASLGGSEDAWSRRQTTENPIELVVLRGSLSLTVQWFLPKDGLYPAASLRVTMLYGMGTLVLKGPKQLSSDPETGTAAVGSILALKATLVAAEEGKA